VLLVTNTHTGRYVLPGGAVDPGESLGEALRREVWEETGIAITDLQLCNAAGDFWYYDPTDTAYHALLFLYTARPQSSALHSRHQVDTDEGDLLIVCLGLGYGLWRQDRRAIWIVLIIHGMALLGSVSEVIQALTTGSPLAVALSELHPADLLNLGIVGALGGPRFLAWRRERREMQYWTPR
jgi:8-oxo-dGTP pyrophosphatase MutT (NUDIX family)